MLSPDICDNDIYDVVYNEWLDCSLELTNEIIDMNIYIVNFIEHKDLTKESCNKKCIATDGYVKNVDYNDSDETKCVSENGLTTVWIYNVGVVVISDATYVRYMNEYGDIHEYNSNRDKSIYYYGMGDYEECDDGETLLSCNEYDGTVLASYSGDPRSIIEARSYFCNRQLVMVIHMDDRRSGINSYIIATNHGHVNIDVKRYDKNLDITWINNGNELIAMTDEEVFYIAV